MTDIISNILNSAIIDLFEEQPDILDTTSQTTMTEWNIAHHLSSNIKKYLFWLDNYNDVVKRHHQNKRPDIIFHKRKRSKYNYLVVEVKKNEEISRDDIQKIQEDWFAGELNYSYGACISFGSGQRYQIKLFKNGEAGEVNIGVNSPRIYRIMGKSTIADYKDLQNRIDRDVDITDQEIKEIFIRNFT